jgi:hypothetical protein
MDCLPVSVSVWIPVRSFNFDTILAQNPTKIQTTRVQIYKMKLNLLLLSAAALVNVTISTATVTPAVVNLRTASNYVILAKTGITNVPTSAITGNIAVSPIAAAAITGFALKIDEATGEFSKSSQVTAGTVPVEPGNVYAADYAGDTPALLTTAISNMETAYTDAAGRTHTDAAKLNLGGGLIGGLTLLHGVYTFGTDINIVSDVTFHGVAPGEVFIIRTTGNIKQAANTRVTLTGTARAENVFWQVAGNVAVGAGAHL